MTRVVLDTNVLISALFWEGNERDILMRCRDGELRSVTSPGILDELERVLTRKFGVPRRKVKDYLLEIIRFSDIVLPSGDLEVVEDDPSDNLVLETAILGRVDVIVTGDRHLLRLGSYGGVGIRSAREV